MYYVFLYFLNNRNERKKRKIKVLVHTIGSFMSCNFFFEKLKASSKFFFTQSYKYKI